MTEATDEIIDDVDDTTDVDNDGGSNYSKEDLETFERLGIDIDNFTPADLAKLAKRVVGSEKTLVDLKKKTKVEPKSTQEDPKKMLSELLDERDFYKGNPDAELYREKIETIRKEFKGISLDDALYLASKNDRQIDSNREVYGQGAVQGKGGSDSGISAVSIDTFDHWTPQQQDKYTQDMMAKHGKIKFK